MKLVIEDAPRVTQEEINEFKPPDPAWQIQTIDGIDTSNMCFSFDSYLAGLDFVSKVANLAEEEDHHPSTLEWEKLPFRGGYKIKVFIERFYCCYETDSLCSIDI